ncbi:uncharacterized protein LOC116296539 [Actinia tenebrosa]|uniref:Uncharacterized protein LOC116296539 n=1 Tax=Actinia tenebrosa TaxID=6105 RepID=A0A6P8I6S7_ACTTE|nr:uncharacterized protein LOC116296539 [Actinia tenebrosa]
MKARRERLLFFGIVAAIFVLLWNNSVLVYKKSSRISLPCEDTFNEKKVEKTRQNSRLGMQFLKPTPSRRVKRFVYLVQTAQCLPAKLLNEQHIGDALRCRCDVAVLSFKQPCEDKNRTFFSHVEYLSRPADGDRISWSAGRNLLFSTSKARNVEYLYYIFMDDDLELSYNKAHTPPSMRSVSPMRSFENFLLQCKPAIGVPNYSTHHSSDIMIKKIKTICKRDHFNSSFVFVPIVHFDASLNAFHKDVVQHILPYPRKYDKTNWWHSQRYVIAASELKFRGQCYMFIPVNSVNTKHGDYPQNDVNANQVWSSIVQNLVSNIPQEYAKEKWIKEFIEDPVKHTENSRAICWRFPLNFSIKPFAYFALNQEYKT